MSRVAPPPVNFAPTLNPQALPHHPFHPSAPPESASVPMMVGHCLEAASRRLDNFELTDAAFRAYAFTNVGEARAAEATALYEGETVASPFLRESRLETDRLEGQAADAVAERKAKVGRVYRYVWALPADARFGATSGADLQATFGRDGTATGQAFTRALVAFATSGDPGWQPFNEQTRATMVFGETARVENDPRGALRRLWLQLKAP
jgi:para-nitrobenzyl esterase